MISRHPPKEQRTIHLTFSVLWTAFLLALLVGCNGDTNASNMSQENKATQTSLNQSITCSEHSSNPVSLTMYYGSEKQAWISDVVSNFNGLHMTACDGPITVKATPIGSGSSMQEIASG